MRRGSFESAVGIGYGTASVIVKMDLNITTYDASKCPNQVINLPRRSTSDGICDSDPMNTDLVDSRVYGEKVDEVRSE